MLLQPAVLEDHLNNFHNNTMKLRRKRNRPRMVTIEGPEVHFDRVQKVMVKDIEDLSMLLAMSTSQIPDLRRSLSMCLHSS